jgi:hypothetical protein
MSKQVQHKCKADIRFKTALIPKGTLCAIRTAEDNDRQAYIYVKDHEREFGVRSENLHKWFKEFENPYNNKFMTADDGTSIYSLSESRIEIDGHDEFGFPSTLKAIGLV